jgi:hypothetical protein
MSNRQQMSKLLYMPLVTEWVVHKIYINVTAWHVFVGGYNLSFAIKVGGYNLNVSYQKNREIRYLCTRILHLFSSLHAEQLHSCFVPLGILYNPITNPKVGGMSIPVKIWGNTTIGTQWEQILATCCSLRWGDSKVARVVSYFSIFFK